MDLAGKLTDVILFYFFARPTWFSFLCPALVIIRGRSNRRIGTYRHPSTRFWSRLLVWRTKSRRPSRNGSQISVGFVFLSFFLFLAFD